MSCFQVFVLSGFLLIVFVISILSFILAYKMASKRCREESVANRQISLPEGWDSYMALPILEPGIAGYDVDYSQDVFTIFTPDERFILDVGWYPDCDPKGKFVCVIVTTDGLPEGSDNPWDQDPVETFETTSTAEVWRWISATVSKLYAEHYLPKKKDHQAPPASHDSSAAPSS